jgi:hypothetical protein
MQLDIRARSRTDPKTGRRSAARSRIIATAIKSSNTNRRARVHKFLRVQNPPTPCPRERVGVRGDSSPVHPRTLAVQLVIVHLQLESFLLPFQWRQGLRRSCLGVWTAPLANRSYRASVAVAYSRVAGFTFLGCGFPLPLCQNGLRATTTVASARPYPNSRPSEENWIENAPNISWL